jgi:mRNA interferase MazF
MTTYKRGDVILVDFPNSDLISYKQRPALVVQDTDLVSDLNQVIVALITTSNTFSNGPTRILVGKDTRQGLRMGLRLDSKIVTDNLVTVRLRAIQKKLGTCGLMAEVDSALKLTLKLL